MRHPDHLARLAASSRLVSTRLSPSGHVKPRGEPVSLMTSDDKFGFDISDKDVNEAAKILRLLHSKEMRRLQTGINECIANIQSMTANPKTDTRLGQVGR